MGKSQDKVVFVKGTFPRITMKSCSYQTAGKNKTIIKTAVGVRETKIFSVDTALQWIRFEEDGKERFITFKKNWRKGFTEFALDGRSEKEGIKILEASPSFPQKQSYIIFNILIPEIKIRLKNVFAKRDSSIR